MQHSKRLVMVRHHQRERERVRVCGGGGEGGVCVCGLLVHLEVSW